ncbi:inositol monophosphatase family protein [Novosphingobium mangrovi (ex Huang et al. 2023)]|uniref:Inositol monophosphatase n=1 Tax=Novosphingobium mangrovi (ex Huang et al. 2023) TaxID=2976432 RepID=A0ABT2I866_9SPHN|nr:inositol monophosphatase family protein [Novosphingobium mangrovi (ex Huang et al. 2023)]MCT2401013.1 inositol monophosphatase [Novosphingobium mangrovi (ex Huang et al. 2023)]
MITPALTRAVEAIMREASERAILPRYQSLSAAQIDAKAPDDVVTVADKDSEALLAERLSALLPEAAVVGEEGVHADPAAMEWLRDRLCWIVDPLDGTNNFAAGKPPFGVLVALADKGETLGGWILDCLTGRFCHAGIGTGAWIDGERVTAMPSGETLPVAAISLIFIEEARREQIRRHIAPYYRLVDIPRCAAEQYPRLVLGTNDVSMFERTLPWDHAAGALFLNEAGGFCARLDGSPYRVDEFERRGMIGASSKALFEELAERLVALG